MRDPRPDFILTTVPPSHRRLLVKLTIKAKVRVAMVHLWPHPASEVPIHQPQLTSILHWHVAQLHEGAGCPQVTVISFDEKNQI